MIFLTWVSFIYWINNPNSFGILWRLLTWQQIFRLGGAATKIRFGISIIPLHNDLVENSNGGRLFKRKPCLFGRGGLLVVVALKKVLDLPLTLVRWIKLLHGTRRLSWKCWYIQLRCLFSPAGFPRCCSLITEARQSRIHRTGSLSYSWVLWLLWFLSRNMRRWELQ